ncbi:MAG: ABC transporter substrate-binding protein [Planctomycetota bacterium]
MGSRRTFLTLAVLAWLALLAVPFFASPARPPVPKHTLTIISPHGPEILDEYIGAFEKMKAAQGDPVHVERIIVGGTGEVERRVRSDFDAITDPGPAVAKDQPPAPRVVVRQGLIDLMWGGGTDPYVHLAKIGALEPYLPPPDLDAAIPAEAAGVVIKPKNHLWIGTAFAGFGIVVNKKVCRADGLPIPKDWSDLAQPCFFDRQKGIGLLGNADIRYTGAIKQCYEAVLQSEGWDRGWQTLTCIAGNSAQFYPNSSQTPEAVGMGNVIAGFSYDRPAMAEIDQRGEDTIAFILPPLTIINPDAIGILEGAPQPALAREFVNFVLSHHGQALWFLKPGVPDGPVRYPLRRMPIRPDVYNDYPADEIQVQINPFHYSFRRPDGKPFIYDDKLASRRRRSMPDLAGAALIDTHPELVRAWARIVRDGCRPAAIQAFAAMPVTEKELAGLDAAWEKNPALREDTLTKWKAFFRAKYARIEADGQ